MRVKLIIFLLFFSPYGVLYANQEQPDDSDIFEFLAMYEKDDAVFIDSEIDNKTVIKTSETDE